MREVGKQHRDGLYIYRPFDGESLIRGDGKKKEVERALFSHEN